MNAKLDNELADVSSGLRSRIAARTPHVLRKFVRMGEHYVRRMVQWCHILREMRGATPRDRAALWTSAMLSPFTSLVRLDGYKSPNLISDLDLIVRGVGKFRVRRGTDDILHVLTAREPEVRDILEQELKSGDVFVDAGANIGFFSVLASTLVEDSGRVIAIEMIPTTVSILESHLAANRCIAASAIDKALSDTAGTKLRASCNPEKFGQASILRETTDVDDIEFEVETTTLNEILENEPTIKLMKMDLEGAEALALAGADQVIDRVQNIVFESNRRDKSLFAMLQSRGYVIDELGGNNFLAHRQVSRINVPKDKHSSVVPAKPKQ